jgi:signal transduction histidine kinase
VIALNPSGQGVFRTDVPFGKAFGAPLSQLARPAVQEGRPTITNLVHSPTRNQLMVGVIVPVRHGDTVTHSLIAGLKLAWLDELLRRQGLPAGTIAGIFDSDFKFVARSHDGARLRGSDPAAGFFEAMKAAPEGLGRYGSHDATSVYTAWTRTRHGWTVAFAVPAEPIDGAFRDYLLVFGGLWAAILAAGLVFAVLTGRRITDSVLRMLDQVRAERNRLLDQERRARAAAEAASKAKDEFLAMLGHELRNPLSAISNSINVIRSDRRTPEQLEFASAVIARQSGTLKRLIDDLLDVGRVMTGKIPLRFQPLDLQTSVDHVVSALQASGTLKRHRVKVTTEPVRITGDPTRIEQVLTNLLVNAASYTPEGGAIEVIAKPDGTKAGAEALLIVRDEGIGIKREDMPRLFELFFQGERPAIGGLGIGLTLVKRLVELHNGTIEVASEGAGKGATFTVRMPAITQGEIKMRGAQ